METKKTKNPYTNFYLTPKVRCSNCEKSVDRRQKDGKISISGKCKATGERVCLNPKSPGQYSPYYQVRKCGEFIPRKEYVDQFENPLDRAMEIIEKGKRIKDMLG